MRVLVTGNSGLIGRVLVTRLSALTNTDVRLFRTLEQPRDICDRGSVSELVRGMDVVFHLAGMLNYRAGTPLIMWKVNVEGTVNVLEEAVAAGVSSIVVASSQEVYAASDGAPGPFDEDSLLRAKGAYGESKLEADRFCMRYLSGGAQVSILRIAAVYGPDSLQRDNIVARFLSDANTGGIIRVYGKGQRIRDLVFIEDVIEAMLRLIGTRGVFNIGGGLPYSTREIAETICGLVGGRIDYDYSQGADTGFYMDISKAQKAIRYQPIGFRTGLLRILETQ